MELRATVIACTYGKASQLAWQKLDEEVRRIENGMQQSIEDVRDEYDKETGYGAEQNATLNTDIE
jgi:hypothetical protein